MLADLDRQRIRVICPPILLIAVAAICVSSGCGGHSTTEGPKAESSAGPEPRLYHAAPDQLAHLKIAKVAKVTWMGEIHTTGTVDWDADHTTQAITQVNGPIARIMVDVGTIVKADQPLLEVSSPDVANAVATYRKARNREILNKRIAERMKDLLDRGVIAQKDYESSVADYNDAMTDVQNSLQALNVFGITQKEILDAQKQGSAVNTMLAVRSPIAGVVVQKLISPGMLIQAGSTVCFMISDVSTVWVQGHIFDHDLPLVRTGDGVEQTNPSFNGVFRGTVSYIGSFVDPATRTTPVRIVTLNPRGLLKKDMFLDAVIRTNTRNETLAVPASAILHDDKNEPLVYVQVREGDFAQRPVTIGDEKNGMIAIKSGLAEGDLVVGDGSLFLQFASAQ
jgi:cobalt-zinc-cadmium efflux system membrane fusion protein